LDNPLVSPQDITVLGGGLAGLTLALHCRQQMPDTTITVLEKRPHPVPEAAFKVGESTVEIGAHYLAEVLGQEKHILHDQLPKLGLRFFFGRDGNEAIERRLELGSSRFAAAPSYQLDRGRLENHLANECLQAGVRFLDATTIKNVELKRGRSHHEIHYVRDGQPERHGSRWVADATGRAALLKRKFQLSQPSPHHANAVWFRIQAPIHIDDWSNKTTWQNQSTRVAPRWYSTNHLMGEGYWVWLIPLASGSTSIGIVADEKIHPLSSFNSLTKALAWLDRYEPQCARQIRQQQSKIQDFGAIKRYAVQCSRVFSARRWGITGESGFFLDPFYSPGSDFIALGNTLLVDLIRRDLYGRGMRFRAMLYDRIFKAFFHGTAMIYENQYQLFGNHQVMPVKILWDWVLYWSLTAFVFFQDRLCDINMYPRHLLHLRKLSRMNRFMQDFFREWHQQAAAREIGGSIDVFDIELLPSMNNNLRQKLDRKSFDRQFADHVAQLETLLWEIIDHAGINVRVPFRRRRHSQSRKGAFRHAFDATTRGTQQNFSGPTAPVRTAST